LLRHLIANSSCPNELLDGGELQQPFFVLGLWLSNVNPRRMAQTNPVAGAGHLSRLAGLPTAQRTYSSDELAQLWAHIPPPGLRQIQRHSRVFDDITVSVRLRSTGPSEVVQQYDATLLAGEACPLV
jgi:hypothetical protein